HPVLLEMLGDGRLHLSGIARLAPILTLENRDRLLARAVHKSKRQIEEMVAELTPRPDAPSAIRKLPERAPGPSLDLLAPALLPPPAPAQSGLSPPPRLGVPHPPVVSPPAPPRLVFEPLPPARFKIQVPPGPTFATTSRR